MNVTYRMRTFNGVNYRTTLHDEAAVTVKIQDGNDFRIMTHDELRIYVRETMKDFCRTDPLTALEHGVNIDLIKEAFTS